MTETNGSIPNGLYSKLADVTSVLTRVEKRGHNDFHNYDYVTEADLIQAVRGELTKRSIAMLASADEVHREGTLTSVKMTFTFVDGESGEAHTASWYGTGEDKGDKGLYKAYTGALKYFLMKTFLIPTGDDPEQQSNEVAGRPHPADVPDGPPVPNAPSEKQLEFIVSLAKTLGADASDQDLLRAYARTFTKDEGSGAINALKGEVDGLDPADALVRFVSKAAKWQEAQSDVPADMEGLPVEEPA